MESTTGRPARQRRKRARFIAVISQPTPDGAVLVRLTQDGRDYYYWLSRVRADFGQGFRVVKDVRGDRGDAYDVNLSAGGDTCTCKGHTHGGYCKHADGIRALVKAGKL